MPINHKLSIATAILAAITLAGCAKQPPHTQLTSNRTTGIYKAHLHDHNGNKRATREHAALHGGSHLRAHIHDHHNDASAAAVHQADHEKY